MHRTFPCMKLKVSAFYVCFLTVRNSINPRQIFCDQMLNKTNYRGKKSYVDFALKGGTCEQLIQLNMVITNKICVCRKQTNFEHVRTFVDIEIAVQFMIITFETRDKISSKIEKSVVSISSMGGKKR